MARTTAPRRFTAAAIASVFAFFAVSSTWPAAAQQPVADSANAVPAQVTCDLSGQWRSTRGVLEIQQISPLVAKPDKALISLLPAKSANGSQGAPVDLGGVAVFGAFTTASGRARFEGVMSGSRLDFNWAAPGDGGAIDSGSGHFDVSADCNVMQGAYRGNKSGSQDLAWQARRVVVADNQEKAPSYETSLADLRQRGSAVLAALSQQAGKLRSLDGLTKTLGSNVADIFALVRDQIAFAPYPGVLRGAQGVLNAGSGNSYDQALLLAALLKAKGHQVRFATGTLSADDALKLVGSYDGGKPAPEAPGLDTELYSAAGFTDAEIAANSTQAAAIADRIRSEAQNYAGLVTKLIADQRPDALPDPAKIRQASRDDARDHAWVQVLENGKWIDLDPSFPGAQIGQVFAEPAQVLDAFPSALDQAVDIKLTAERLEGGKIATETVGNWHVRVASLSDAASPGLQLKVMPLNSGAALSRKWRSDEIEAAGAYYLDKTLNTGNIFQPALVANDGTAVAGPVVLACRQDRPQRSRHANGRRNPCGDPGRTEQSHQSLELPFRPIDVACRTTGAKRIAGRLRYRRARPIAAAFPALAGRPHRA